MVPMLTWCSWILNSCYLGTLLFQSDQILSRTRSDVDKKAQMVSRVDDTVTSNLICTSKVDFSYAVLPVALLSDVVWLTVGTKINHWLHIRLTWLDGACCASLRRKREMGRVLAQEQQLTHPLCFLINFPPGATELYLSCLSAKVLCFTCVMYLFKYVNSGIKS